MIRLSALIAGVSRDAEFTTDPVVSGLTADSRAVQPGFLFAALPGTRVDGSAFARAAVTDGAVAVLASAPIEGLGVPVVVSDDVRRAYAKAAAAFYGAGPATVVAVTGTNGKTSTAVFARQIFAALGHKAASLGTLGVTIGEAGRPDETVVGPGLTTPDAGELARIAAELAKRGVTHLALEASSHGIDQRRLDGMTFAAAGFSNLSQDHLDYHGDMAAYRDAKLRLFTTLLPEGAPAVLNADSAEAGPFAQACARHGHPVMTVGEAGGLLRLNGRRATPQGQTLTLETIYGETEVRLPLAGDFQADNALLAAGLCIAAGEDVRAVVKALEGLTGAPGRLQHVGAGPRGGEAYVDYAHTPDGLRTLLQALRPHTAGKLIVVFGAGGDRDRGKRPLMGAEAARLADLAIVTDDNPRTEDPAAIRRDVLAGAPGAPRLEIREIGDRRAAIAAGVEALREDDVLVVAGKGHEQGQTVGGVVHPFDDVAEVKRALEAVHA